MIQMDNSLAISYTGHRERTNPAAGPVLTQSLFGTIIDIEREPAGKTVSPQNGSSKMTAILRRGAVIFFYSSTSTESKRNPRVADEHEHHLAKVMSVMYMGIPFREWREQSYDDSQKNFVLGLWRTTLRLREG